MTDVRTSLHPFYVTFGVRYSRTPDYYGTETHPYWPGADGRGWVRITAHTQDQAMTLAQAYFGEHYAFCYPADKFDTTADREYYPLGELAVIELGNLAIEGDGPKPIVTTSEPQLYGVAPGTTIGARIIGRLKQGSDEDAVEKVGYDMEYVHREHFMAGVELFDVVDEVDQNVMAYEMDWANPWDCAVCRRPLH